MTEENKQLRLNRFLTVYSSAFVLSIALSWVIGAFALSSPTLRFFDERLGKTVPIPGSSTLMRSEGRATTTFGKHGLSEVDWMNASNGLPNVILWGDSYVQALQLDESLKMNHVAETLLNRKCNVIAIGDSGYSVADYYFLMPRYKGVIPDSMLNLIFLGGINDVLPENPSALFSQVRLDEGASALVWEKRSDKHLVTPELGVDANLARPFFFRLLARKIRNSLPPRLYRTEISRKSESESKKLPALIDRFWDLMLRDMKQASDHPLAFLYAPHVPNLELAGLSLEDPEAEVASRFALACKRNNVPFYDLSDSFRTAFETDHSFARGFENTRLGFGHLNAKGHELAGALIADVIRESNAIHAD